jgi:hypothetical protein
MGKTRNAYKSKSRRWADNIKVDLLERQIVRMEIGWNYTEVREGMNINHRPPVPPRYLH